MNKKIKIAVVLMLIALPVCQITSASTRSVDLSDQDLAYLKLAGATVRVAVDHAEMYATPTATDTPNWTVSWVQALPVDSQRISQLSADWIPIKGTNGKKASKGKEGRPDLWIRRQNIVLAGELKKVIGCWPIKSLTYVSGDYTADVSFNKDGSAMVREWGDDQIDRDPPQQAHLYMGKNIVFIEGKEKSFFVSGYRPAEQKMYPEGGSPLSQKLFDVADLEGCKSEPLLEK